MKYEPHPTEIARTKRLDKQYWVLSAIYRMVRINQWPLKTASRLLHERAKYKTEMAQRIAELWFSGCQFKGHKS